MSLRIMMKSKGFFLFLKYKDDNSSKPSLSCEILMFLKDIRKKKMIHFLFYHFSNLILFY